MKKTGEDAREKEKGFTLVEIIAVLAAVTIPSIVGFLKIPVAKTVIPRRSKRFSKSTAA
ncbi:prepilin-type N-terminal cleavage/methylation domain-containing protein [Fumia xinanensis]|uniref:Prepilin-type N-terminal cleavage/methylation domain-containing protein n=1 Tax=Fumia xinanensis TaxID=2763659 RepID=A0A926I297_9FIRM|nr:prepilin-type N-terminal cleavage/methylation domain-containing protein [Fumia xinanensis]MBC8559333.1 prepilin-type N-terminal cleavage/methylation domain-containing protein [Fumia xinanensis]